MLGLPDQVQACLFDLDGVLTKTASVHAAAWKEMFDAFLQQRSRQTGEQLRPFDAVADYDEYVDGRPRYDGVRSFLDSRGIELPSGNPSDGPDVQTIDGLGNHKNEIVLRLIDERGVQAYAGSVRYLHAVQDAGIARAVVSSSSNCRQVLMAAGIEGFFDARIDGVVAEREHLHGKPAPDTFLAGARALGVEPGRAAVFEDALAGVEAGRAGHFGVRRWRRPCRSGRRPARARRGCRGRRPAGAARRVVIEHPAFTVEPWRLRETALDLDLLEQTESMFALANGHIGLRGTLDEGEPAGTPGSYLNGVYEARPLPYAEAGYGYPEAGQTVVNVTNGKLIRLLVDDEPLDVRFGGLRSHERELDFRAGVLRRRCEWVSPTGKRIRIASTRLVSLTQRAVAAIAYEVELPTRRFAWWCSPSWSPTSRWLTTRQTRAGVCGSARCCAPSSSHIATAAPCWCIARPAAACGSQRRWTIS